MVALLLVVGLISFGLFASTDNFLRVANPADVETLDPALLSDAISSRVAGQIYDHLVEFGADGGIIPGLAERWEFSDDGQVVTFWMREGITFHDGNVCDAEAVKFSLERVMDEELASPNRQKYVDILDAIVVVNATTLELHLTAPSAAFLPLYIIASAACPVSPAAVAAWGDDFGFHPVGTGPFVFDEYRPDEYVRLVRYDGFWGEQPELAGMIFKAVPEPLARVIELQTGAVDLILEVPVEEMPRLQSDPGITVQSDPMSSVRGLWFNHGSSALTDVRVRLALAMALDMNDIFQAFLEGFAVQADSLVPMGGWAHDGTLTAYPYDVAGAMTLLADAGWTDTNGDGILDRDGSDFHLVIISPEGRYLMDEEISNAAAYQWGELGIDVELQVLKSTTWVAQMKAEEFDVNFLGFAKDIPEPALFLDPLVRTGGRSNFFGYSNPSLDVLIDAGGATFDQEERTVIYHQAQQLMRDDVTFLPIYNDIGYIAKRADLQFTWSAMRRHYLREASFEL
jgi:peptide/nickel transport system substrate-binding protein